MRWANKNEFEMYLGGGTAVFILLFFASLRQDPFIY